MLAVKKASNKHKLGYDMNGQAQLELIQRWAQELGFQDIGVSDLDLSQYQQHLARFLARGYHGDMGYLSRNQSKRLHPNELVPNTCRVLSARMDYLPPDTQPLRVLADANRGYVSRYALGRDYHKVVRRRLRQLASRINAQFARPDGSPDAALRAFTDSAPVLEKALGAKAGLGWIGKHTLLLNKTAGSWFFLGELFTSLALPLSEAHVEDSCGNCKACMTVCPTQAIVGPQQLDARRCISYLTIEHKGSIPTEFRAAMGNRIYGCDDCQLYCPWNRFASESHEADFGPRHNLAQPELLELFSWSEADFLRRTEGSAIRRIDYQQWRRNLAIALGNAPASEPIVAALKLARSEATQLVTEHIDWALARQAQK